MNENKRYQVQANKSTYITKSFATTEEAIEAATRLVNEGFSLVSVRDTEADGDIW